MIPITANIRMNSDGTVIDYHPSEKLIRLDKNGLWCTYRNRIGFYRRSWNNQIFKINNHVAYECSQNLHFEIQHQIKKICNRLLEISNHPTTHLTFYGSHQKTKHLKNRLNTALNISSDQYEKQSHQFFDTYPEDIPIVPPDHYNSLILFPTLGCPYGQCHFCMFYKNKKLKILSENEFQQHIIKSNAMFKKSNRNYSKIFFGSANSLLLNQSHFIKLMNLVDTHLGDHSKNISCFYDPNHSPSRSVSDFKELYHYGLRQTVIGLETGSPTIRKKLGKSENLSIIKKSINDQQKAGIKVGLCVLSGIKTIKTEMIHQKETLEFIKSLSLNKSAHIYISPLQHKTSPSNLIFSNFCSQKLHSLLKKSTLAKIIPYRPNLWHPYT